MKTEDILMVCEPSSWGGRWTEEKLDAFEKYVNAYLTIMNKHRDKYQWKLIYFDGFAGSGSRNEENREEDSELLQNLFKGSFLEKDELNIYKGAAERVLNISQRGFNYYYFIDKDEESSLMLQQRLSKYKATKNLAFRVADANKQIEIMVNAMRKDNKLTSLVLLDPFGMQVDWKTIELLKGTHTDLWILIPTGVIVNRLLDKKGELPYIDKLMSFFGKDEEFLRAYFYAKRQEPTLFGMREIVEKVNKPIQKIAELYIQQLQIIFKHVTPQPLVLRNSRNVPIFHFACASNNPAAVKIANEIIEKKTKV